MRSRDSAALNAMLLSLYASECSLSSALRFLAFKQKLSSPALTMCSFCSFKCWFIFFNSIFLASGIAIIVIGALQYTTYSQMSTFAGSSLSKIAIVLMAIGVAIVLVSLLGHVGAFANNFSMMACFICILILIILLEVLTGAAFYMFIRRIPFLQMNSAINSRARDFMSDYSPENRLSIDRMQQKFRCCGADGYTDWYSSASWGKSTAVPDSCCIAPSEGCGQHKEKIHTKGCITAIKLFLLKNLVWVSAVCIALGIGEVFGVLVGVCVCINIKRKQYENLS
ncbi:CD63 antigen-like [Betta splendens]|uniref:Tetraspanin n=1 Tax=Betta splendens TaxID=158456 RepID=A0A6P7LAU5_BETSP|nr:CD63 antigen-like [Betta splendens]